MIITPTKQRTLTFFYVAIEIQKSIKFKTYAINSSSIIYKNLHDENIEYNV